MAVGGAGAEISRERETVAVSAPVGASDGKSVGAPEGCGTGSTEGAGFGRAEGWGAGNLEGSGVGIGLWEGMAVGSVVGSGVGELVGFSDGSSEGAAVGVSSVNAKEKLKSSTSPVGCELGAGEGTAVVASPGAIFTSWKVTTEPPTFDEHLLRACKKLSNVRVFRTSTTLSVTLLAEAGIDTMCVPPSYENPKANALLVQVDETVTSSVQVAPGTQLASALRSARSTELKTVPPCTFVYERGTNGDGKTSVAKNVSERRRAGLAAAVSPQPAAVPTARSWRTRQVKTKSE